MAFHTVDTRVPFVGRLAEVRQVVELFEGSGVLTILGPGGVGKSRLTAEAALRFQPREKRHVHFIPFAGVTEGNALEAVLSALHIADAVGADRIVLLREHLRRVRPALIFDNCEHLAGEIRALIDALRDVEDLAIVATSQRRLRYAGEAILRIDPFPEKEATQFFIARAGLDEGSLAPQARDAITQIVTRLDGMAIAIDLAAARLKSISLHELSESLLALTPSKMRSMSAKNPRHRTIGNTIAWALAQLSELELKVFALSSIWSETFDADDVTEIAGEHADRTSISAALDVLAEYSLIVRSEQYSMLAPIRAVAARILAATPYRRGLERRFAMRMDAIALAARERYESVDPGNTVAMVTARYNDYCAALSWALEQPRERMPLVMEIAPILCVLWADGGRSVEGTRWAERLVAVAEDFAPALRGRIYWTAVRVAHAAHEFERLISVAQLAVTAFSIAGSQIGLARAYNSLSTASMSLGRFEAAESYIETALAIYTTLGHERGISVALTNAGNIALDGRRDPTAARAFYERALEILMRVGNDALIGITYGNLAEADLADRRYDACEQSASRAIRYFIRARSTGLLGWQRQLLARVSIARHDLAKARTELRDAWTLLRQAPAPLYVALAAETTARLLSREGAFSEGALASQLARRLRTVRRIPGVGPGGAEVRSDEALLARRLRAETLAKIAGHASAIDLEAIPEVLEGLLASTMVEASGGEQLVQWSSQAISPHSIEQEQFGG